MLLRYGCERHARQDIEDRRFVSEFLIWIPLLEFFGIRMGRKAIMICIWIRCLAYASGRCGNEQWVILALWSVDIFRSMK